MCLWMNLHHLPFGFCHVTKAHYAAHRQRLDALICCGIHSVVVTIWNCTSCRLYLYFCVFFSWQYNIVDRGICHENVCPSVCLSHSPKCFNHFEICFAPLHRTVCLVSLGQISLSWAFRFTPNEYIYDMHCTSNSIVLVYLPYYTVLACITTDIQHWLYNSIT